MGGNVFLTTARLCEREYTRLGSAVRQFLAAQGVKKFGIPPQVRDKEELVKEFKGDVEPYGDVDVIVGIRHFDQVHDLTKGLARHLGGDGAGGGGLVRGSGRIRSVLTREKYQVDLRFCFEEECDFMVAMKGNNDFSGILGHLLSPYRLKVSDRGFMIKQEILDNEFGTVERTRQDLLLSKDHRRVCGFLGLPDEILDGKTRFSVAEIFDVIMRSNVYFHDGEFEGEYWTDKARATRPMFQKFRSMIEAYDGEFEAQKEDTEVRRRLRQYREKRSAYRPEFENFVFSTFGKTEEGEAARVKPQREEANFSFRQLFEWFPDSMDEDTAREVMRLLRAKFNKNRRETFQKWADYTSREEIRREVEQIVAEITGDGGWERKSL